MYQSSGNGSTDSSFMTTHSCLVSKTILVFRAAQSVAWAILLCFCVLSLRLEIRFCSFLTKAGIQFLHTWPLAVFGWHLPALFLCGFSADHMSLVSCAVLRKGCRGTERDCCCSAGVTMAYINPSLTQVHKSSSAVDRQREYLLDMIPSRSISQTANTWK